MARIDEIDTEQIVTDFQDECLKLLDGKNSDYGASWAYSSQEAHVDRILQKVIRIKRLLALERKGLEPSVSEGVEAELHDIANYAAFAYHARTKGPVEL